VLRILAQLLAPMVPHLAEEVWSKSGGQGMVVDAAWPVADPAMLVSTTAWCCRSRSTASAARKSRCPRTCDRVLTEGDVNTFTSYSASGTLVATNASEIDAGHRLMRLLADQIVTRLIATSGDWGGK
jgi:valyl-tRNA synthetase